MVASTARGNPLSAAASEACVVAIAIKRNETLLVLCSQRDYISITHMTKLNLAIQIRQAGLQLQDVSMTTQILYCSHNKADKHRNLTPNSKNMSSER
jgi:hypothetical protein